MNKLFLTEIDGKLGGIYGKRDHCGQHFQTMPNPRGEGSKYQKKVNKIFQRVSKEWGYRYFKGSRQDRRTWSDWAKEHPVKNKKGEDVTLSPFNAFVSINCHRVQDGLPIIYKAPFPDRPPPPPMLPTPTIGTVSVGPLYTEVDIHFGEDMMMTTDREVGITDMKMWFGTTHGTKKPYHYERIIGFFWLSPTQLRIKSWGYLWFRPRRISYTQGQYPFKSREHEYNQRSFDLEIPLN